MLYALYKQEPVPLAAGTSQPSEVDDSAHMLVVDLFTRAAGTSSVDDVTSRQLHVVLAKADARADESVAVDGIAFAVWAENVSRISEEDKALKMARLKEGDLSPHYRVIIFKADGFGIVSRSPSPTSLHPALTLQGKERTVVVVEIPKEYASAVRAIILRDGVEERRTDAAWLGSRQGQSR
jgi:hypothetical protein